MTHKFIKWTVFFSIFVVGILILFVILNISQKKGENTPFFIQFVSYVSSPVNSDYTFDFVYFVDKSKTDMLKQERIERVYLENSDTLEIIKYRISEGGVSKKYKIMTLSATIKFLKKIS